MRTDVYEHLIQRYGEEISQNAEDFMTPKDVARLTTELLFANEDTLLNADRFEGRTFSYQLVNPSYGKKWKKEKEKDTVLEEMGRGFEDRFGAGKPDIDDESMLFMQNVAAKMASPEEGGGKEAIVLSGSLLVNGYAGSGPSSIRRWLFSEDLVDCVVKLSAEIFYRTGIATYICVLNDHKPENRKGVLQLIDASEEKAALRKSQRNKRISFDAFGELQCHPNSGGTQEPRDGAPCASCLRNIPHRGEHIDVVLSEGLQLLLAQLRVCH